jgi:UDP-3-O-[3-hydroxymyristoyl] N-acetylglucosamine deacetylase
LLFSFQRTIKNPVGGFGIGLHSGESTSIKLIPALENTGITFKRTDIQDPAQGIIKADYSSVCSTMLCTTIANKFGVKVSTVEHLMAALWGCGIDNIIVEIDKQEVPIMDGSAEPFVFLIECAGIKEQLAPRKIIEILKEIRVSDGDAYATVKPASQFLVTMEIDFDNKVIAKQKSSFDSNELSFKMDLSRARTFGFMHEVEKLKEIGLAKGATLENAIAVTDEKILNEGGLRYKDEFVKHKILDSIGDFYLAGGFIKGHFHGVKSGHGLNNKLLRKIFADDNAWRSIELPIDQLHVISNMSNLSIAV